MIFFKMFLRNHKFDFIRSSKPADLLADKVGISLRPPTVTRRNSVFDAVGRLVGIFEQRQKLDALNHVCTVLNIPAFTGGK